MTTSSPFGGGEATERPKYQCPVPSNLMDLVEPVEAPGGFWLWAGETDEGGRYLSAVGRRPDGDIETRGESVGEVTEKLRAIAADALRAAYWLTHGRDDWGGAVREALTEWLEAQR